MRRALQFFRDGQAPNNLFCLASDGTVWRRMMTGFGPDGRGFPQRVWWRLADRSIPHLPEHVLTACELESFYQHPEQLWVPPADVTP